MKQVLINTINGQTKLVVDEIKKRNIPLLNKFGEDNFVEVVQKGAVEKAAQLAKEGLTAKSGKFVPLCHGTNAAKENKVLYCREDIQKAAFAWLTNDANFAKTKMAMAKLAAYMGVLCCPQKPLGFPLNPENVIVVDSTMINVKCFGTRDGVPIDNVDINAFDGEGMLHIPENIVDSFSEEEKEKYRKIVDFTIRAPWMKGHITTSFNFHKWCDDNKITTIYGKNVNDIYMIVDKTVFKAPDGVYENWDAYCKAFHNNGHSFNYVLKEDKMRPHKLSYQQLQSCEWNPYCHENMKNIANKEKHYIEELANKKYKLFDKSIKAIIKNVNGLITLPYFKEYAERTYARMRNEALGASLHNVAHCTFIAPDPIAFMEHACSMKVKGCISPLSVVCENENTGEVVISRNPHTDAGALCVRKIVRNAQMRNYITRTSNTLYVSVFDDLPVRIRCDYDGDHVMIVRDADYIGIVKATHGLFDEVIDFTCPKQEKVEVTFDNIAAYIGSVTKTNQLGYYNNALAKVYENEGVSTGKVRYLTRKINIAVDASKHGDTDEEDEEWVEAYKKFKLPAHVGYANLASHKIKEINPEKYETDFSKETTVAAFVAATVNESTPEHLEFDNEVQLEIADILFCAKEDVFAEDWRANVIGISNYKKENGQYVGLFQKMAQYLEDIRTECLKTEDGRKAMSEEIDNIVDLCHKRLRKVANNDGSIMRHMYDVITVDLFTHSFKDTNGGAFERDKMFRAWCLLFGMTAENIVCSKKNVAIDHDLIDDATLVIDEEDN